VGEPIVGGVGRQRRGDEIDRGRESGRVRRAEILAGVVEPDEDGRSAD
jgi:hypothetical protein